MLGCLSAHPYTIVCTGTVAMFSLLNYIREESNIVREIGMPLCTQGR